MICSIVRLKTKGIHIIEWWFAESFYPVAGNYWIGYLTLFIAVYFAAIVISGSDARGPCVPFGIFFDVLGIILFLICFGWSFGERGGERVELRDGGGVYKCAYLYASRVSVMTD